MKHIIECKPQPGLAQVKLLSVDENADGQRLDNFLIRQLAGVPKTHVYRIIRSGEVRVNKGRAHADTRVAQGDVVRVPPVRVSERAEQKKERMAQAAGSGQVQANFPVVWEDEAFLAINKPAGVAVHGGSGVSFGVIEQLRMARPQAKFLELVHRIDRETSGLLLIAKKKSALKNLQEQFRGRETGKVYLASVKGLWPEKLKVLDKPLHKTTVNEGTSAEERRAKVVPKDHPDGMPALSLVKIRATTPARDELPQAITAMSIAYNGARALGPALAGVVYGIASGMGGSLSSRRTWRADRSPSSSRSWALSAPCRSSESATCLRACCAVMPTHPARANANRSVACRYLEVSRESVGERRVIRNGLPASVRNRRLFGSSPRKRPGSPVPNRRRMRSSR